MRSARRQPVEREAFGHDTQLLIQPQYESRKSGRQMCRSGKKLSGKWKGLQTGTGHNRNAKRDQPAGHQKRSQCDHDHVQHNGIKRKGIIIQKLHRNRTDHDAERLKKNRKIPVYGANRQHCGEREQKTAVQDQRRLAGQKQNGGDSQRCKKIIGASDRFCSRLKTEHHNGAQAGCMHAGHFAIQI